MEKYYSFEEAYDSGFTHFKDSDGRRLEMHVEMMGEEVWWSDEWEEPINAFNVVYPITPIA